MKTTTTKATGIKVNAGIKAGGFMIHNHSEKVLALRVKSSLRAGAGFLCRNHNTKPLSLRVKSSLRAGAGFLCKNHSAKLLAL